MSAATAKGKGHAVRKGVVDAIRSAATYYKLPVTRDCVLLDSAAPRTAVDAKPADTLPDSVLLALEHLALSRTLTAAAQMSAFRANGLP